MYVSCGRKIGQQVTEFRKGQRDYGDAPFASSTLPLPTRGRFGRYCDRKACRGQTEHCLTCRSLIRVLPTLRSTRR